MKNGKIFSYTLNTIIIFALGYFLFNNVHLFKNLLNINTIDIALIIIMQAIYLWFAGYSSYLIGIKLGVKIKDFFALQIANRFFNLILPSGGAVFRAIYLKNVYKLSYSKYVTLLLGTYLVTIFTSATISLVIIIYLLNIKATRSLQTIAATLIAIIIASLFIFRTKPFKTTKWKISKNINKVIQGWEKIKKHKKLIGFLILLSIISLIILAARLYIILPATGTGASITQACFLAIITFLTTVISITPGNIGVREILFAASSHTIGIGYEEAIFASLVLRVISYILPLTTGPFIYRNMQNRITKNLRNEKI